MKSDPLDVAYIECGDSACFFGTRTPLLENDVIRNQHCETGHF